MPNQSAGEARPEDTLANDAVRYLLLRTQLPSMAEVKALDRRRRQTIKVLSAYRTMVDARRDLRQSDNLLRTYLAVTTASMLVWVGAVAFSDRAAAFAAPAFLVAIMAIGIGVLIAAGLSIKTLMTRRSHARRLHEVKQSLRKMAAALAPRMPVERVVKEAKRSFPKFDIERRRIDGVKETVKVLRSNVAMFWFDVITTMQEADRRNLTANIDALVRAEAQQYLNAWGQPPMAVDHRTKPRFGWTGFSDDQVREWDHWSHLVTAASGTRRAMSAMGVPLPVDECVQLPPELVSHSNRWQESHGIPVGYNVTVLQEQPVSDFEEALHLGESPAKIRFLSLVSASERSHVRELLSLPEAQ